MFYFFHTSQTNENVNYYKGILFERLVRQYLEALGYDVELRQKRNSLEYDLNGIAKLDGRKLIGEAKAHGKPITGEMFTSFVGKLYPMHAQGEVDSGLFVSTSSLSPEADDYRRNGLSKTTLRVIVLTGDALMTDIIQRLRLPSPDTLHAYHWRPGLYPLSHHLLTTDSAIFVVQVAALDGGATPAAFAVFRSDGNLITDSTYLNQLRDHIQDFAELEPIAGKDGRSIQALREGILQGLILGSDWADYRLPAPPEFFVGRSDIVERVLDALDDPTTPAVIQIKSRSGVGKSSLMAVIADRLDRPGSSVCLYDARNIKSVLDLWAVMQTVTGCRSPAGDPAEVQSQVASLRGRQPRTVLMVDQFESTFAQQDLFDAYELIAISAAQSQQALRIVFARKNDQLTTYDDSRVSLERLNQLSRSFVLDDFGATEAVELISRISEHSEFQISPDVKMYVLEFAQGFPWLLKRTMAHVLKLLRQGTPQSELIPSALRLDDLFNEELEELDEIERAYLVRVAQRTPATYQELERYFDEDSTLSPVLEKLTRHRLLRLSGTTYDTYNDVFKEYLVYRRLPEFSVSFVYRQNPGPSLVRSRRPPISVDSRRSSSARS